MPRDHYISQVHLKRFYSKDLKDKMFAMRKANLNAYTCGAKSQCQIEGGSSNKYLTVTRAVEEFLKTIESNYNLAVDKFANDKIDNDAVYVIAGFVSYMVTCSPAAMRIMSASLRGAINLTAKTLDKQGDIPPPPASLGGKNLTELLDNGDIEIDVDPKYPQALGINNILEFVTKFGNFSWEILINNNIDCPFITSDYPVAIETGGFPGVINHTIPLAPEIAIRIIQNLQINTDNFDFSFNHFRYKYFNINRKEVVDVNRQLVRAAESVVFYQNDSTKMRAFIKKNRNFRVDCQITHLPTNGGTMLVSSQKIVLHQYS